MAGSSVVVRGIARADAELVRRLGVAGVATVHEASGREGLLEPYMRPVWEGAAAAGTAVTVLCPPGDNLMVHVAIECCHPGDVLVVALASASTDGFIGELLATSLRARGVVGVVIDAGARDVAALREMRFPVWSRAVSARGTVKATVGSVNVPVVCAGQLVCPGDVVVADDDGVVCVPAARAAEVAERSEERVRREEETRAKLAAGALGVDLYGLRRVVGDLGLVYLDGQPADGQRGAR